MYIFFEFVYLGFVFKMSVSPLRQKVLLLSDKSNKLLAWKYQKEGPADSYLKLGGGGAGDLLKWEGGGLPHVDEKD